MGIHINLPDIKEKNTRQKNKIPLIIKLLIFAITIFLNVLSWNSHAFCDWYIENILPLWVNTYSRFFSIFPVSVGEKLIIKGIIMLASGVVILLGGFF